MAKDKRDTAGESATSGSPLDLAKHVDPAIRSQVQGVLLANPTLGLEGAIRMVTQGIADGLIAKSEKRAAPTDAVGWPAGTKVVVRRCQGGEFTYGGRTLDRNQVFELTGLPKDEQLGRLGYISMLNEDVRLERCGTCGAEFLDATSASAHYTKRHQPKPERQPLMEGKRPGETKEEYDAREAAWRQALLASEDAHDRSDDAAEDQRAPLYLDQTKASRA